LGTSTLLHLEVVADGLQGEGHVWLIGVVVCLHGALQFQVFTGAGE